MLFGTLDTLLFPIPRTHYLHIKKLAEGFIQNGFHHNEIKKLDYIYNLGEEDVLYVSNHFSCDKTHRLFNKYLSKKLLKALKKTKCKIILWHFHTAYKWSNFDGFGERLIHLGHHIDDLILQKQPNLKEFRNTFDVLQLDYGTPMIKSQKKPLFIRERKYSCNYIGAGYKKEYLNFCKDKYKSMIIVTPPSVNEPLRWNSFKDSYVNLAFHAKNNILNGFITERFWEAISLGGLILHDHPLIKRLYGDRKGLRMVTNTESLKLYMEESLNMSVEEEKSYREMNYQIWLDCKHSYKEQAKKINDYFYNKY